MITSKANAKIKEVKKLVSSAKERRRSGLFIASGTRLVSEVPDEFIERIYVSQNSSGDVMKVFIDNKKCELVSGDVFAGISDTVSPQGVIAVVRQPGHTMVELLEKHLIVLLDDIRDPGNLGTIMRTAEAAGAGVIMSPGCADIFNPKTVRSTMGSIFRVPFLFAEPEITCGRLKENGFGVYAAALKGGVPYTEPEYKEKTAFVVGNEANGISAPVLAAAGERVFIPMDGEIESLNAAVSAAVLMFHFKNLKKG